MNVNFNLILGFAMAAVYTAAGIFLILADETFDIIPAYRIAFGCLMLVYGMFRGWRVYSKYYLEDDENDE